MIHDFFSVDCSVVFWTNEAKLDEHVPFQMSITVPANIDLSDLPLTTLRLFLSDGTIPISIKRIPAGDENGICLTRLGHICADADGVEEKEVESTFRWRPGSTLVLSGKISSSIPREIQVRIQ